MEGGGDIRFSQRLAGGALERTLAGFFERKVLDGHVSVQRFLDQRGAGRITDDGVHGGDQDGVFRQPAFGFFSIGADAHHAFIGEGVDCTDGDLHGFKQVVGNDGHHHVQFQLAGLRGQVDGGIATDDVEHGHVQHLSHHRVDLAWHDARPGLNGRQPDFVQAGCRSGREQAEIVGDANERDGQGSQGCGKISSVSHRLHGFKQVIGRIQAEAGQF
jgi:hypothetical protein